MSTRAPEALAAPAPAAASVRWALAALSLCMLLPALGTSIANVALPTLAESFGASFQQVQWVVLAYLLATTTLIVGAGRLADLVGRRRLLLAGVALFAAASLLCGLARGLPLLVAARALQGVGAAVLTAHAMAFVGEVVPKARTGAAMGLLGAMSAVGTALGPTLGGLLIAWQGWQAIFWVQLPPALAALWLAQRALPPDPRRPTAARVPFDHLGTLLLGLALGAFALAMTLGRGRFGALNAALLLAAAVAAGAFVATQARSPSPLVRLAMLRDGALSASLVMSAIVSTVVMATLVVGPFYLSRTLALDAAHVGLVMSAGPLVAAFAGVPAGRAVDRFGAPRAMRGALAGMSAGALALALMPATFGVAGYVAALVMLTAHYALFQAANNTSVMADVTAPQRGVVSGLLNLSRNLGLITGASAMGAVFSFAVGTVASAAAGPEAAARGMRATFALAAVLLVVALALASRTGARGPAPPA